MSWSQLQRSTTVVSSRICNSCEFNRSKIDLSPFCVGEESACHSGLRSRCSSDGFHLTLVGRVKHPRAFFFAAKSEMCSHVACLAHWFHARTATGGSRLA